MASTKKTILITGASAGLGEEMARQFAALGHDLALCARRLDRLKALAEGLRSSYPSIRVEVRVLDFADGDSAFEDFENAFGRSTGWWYWSARERVRRSRPRGRSPAGSPRLPTLRLGNARSSQPSRPSAIKAQGEVLLGANRVDRN